MTGWDRLWDDLTSRQPLPDPAVVLAAGAVALALVLWRGSWPRVRLLVTVVHEAGHALVALLVGRRLQLHPPGTAAVTRSPPCEPARVG